MPSAEIARRLGGISERVVRYRIDRLVTDKAIRLTAIVNPKAAGYPVVADVWMEIEPGHVMEVARQMTRFEQVSYVACATGDRDLSLQIFASGNEELFQFVTEVLGQVPWVRKTSTILVPMILKDVYDWHIPEGTSPDRKEGGP
jgi:Lrp/AsnC family transcriptional regulator for asnA, asnC and gidA